MVEWIDSRTHTEEITNTRNVLKIDIYRKINRSDRMCRKVMLQNYLCTPQQPQFTIGLFPSKSLFFSRSFNRLSITNDTKNHCYYFSNLFQCFSFINPQTFGTSALFPLFVLFNFVCCDLYQIIIIIIPHTIYTFRYSTLRTYTSKNKKCDEIK